MRVVQLLSHDGFLHALTEDGSIYYLASDPEDGEEYWFRIEEPADPEEIYEYPVLKFDHIPEGAT